MPDNVFFSPSPSKKGLKWFYEENVKSDIALFILCKAFLKKFFELLCLVQSAMNVYIFRLVNPNMKFGFTR